MTTTYGIGAENARILLHKALDHDIEPDQVRYYVRTLVGHDDLAHISVDTLRQVMRWITGRAEGLVTVRPATRPVIHTINYPADWR